MRPDSKLLLVVGPLALLLWSAAAGAQVVSAPDPSSTRSESGALITFAPARPDIHYFLRVRAATGSTTECYTPCTVALPAGPTHVSVVSPRGFERDLVLSGRPTLMRIGHLSPWRYWVGGLLLAVSLAEFTYGAVMFPWNGGGSTTAASEAAAAWAFGALELTSAATLLAIAGKDRVDVIDDPAQLRSGEPHVGDLRLAGVGVAPSPRGASVGLQFIF